MNNFWINDLPHFTKILYRKWERSTINLSLTKNRKKFFENCLDEHLIPPSLANSIRLRNDDTPFHEIKALKIKDVLQSTKIDIDTAYYRVRQNANALRRNVNPELFDRMMNFGNNRATWESENHRQILNRKTESMERSSKWAEFTRTDNIVDLSGVGLTRDQTTLLRLGLNFNSEPEQKETVDTAATFDNFFHKHSERINDEDTLKGLIAPTLLSIKNRKNNLPKRLRKARDQLRKNKNLCFLPADKGGKIVIMTKFDLILKTSNLLSRSNYKKLNASPLENYHKNYRKDLKRITDIYKTRVPELEEVAKRSDRPNMNLPQFYCLPKVHKPNTPMRPIVSTVGSITPPLAQWLTAQLTPFLGTISGKHLKNNVDFKNKVCEFTANTAPNRNFRMMSLDVKALYDNVPLTEVLDFIDRKIAEGAIRVDTNAQHFRELLELCTKQIYFECDNKYYKQVVGLPMGSPLSGVLANLYMEYLEDELLPTLAEQPLLWLRYVDDVFIIWPDNLDFENFFSRVNTLAPTINFTVEKEANGCLPFLDTTVIRNNTQLNFKVYRKPNSVNTYIHNFSNHPFHIKRATMFSMFHRAHKICDEMYLNDEINIITKTFEGLGYSRHTIRKVLSDVRRTHFRGSSPRREHEAKPTISLPFNSCTEQVIKPLFQEKGVHVTFKSTNTLKSHLVRTKLRTSTPTLQDQPGVYSIPCRNCPKAYFGQTGKKFSTRLNQHKYYARGTSAQARGTSVFKHMSQENHAIDFDHAALIYPCSRWKSRLAVERCLIDSNPNFNAESRNQSITCQVNSLSRKIIFDTNPIIRTNLQKINRDRIHRNPP